jgi:hypothetical protein
MSDWVRAERDRIEELREAYIAAGEHPVQA